MAEAGKKVKYDDFVVKVVKDPSNVPAVVAISGFTGPSSDADYTRIYHDIHLSSYTDIKNDAVVHAQELPDSPLGGSVLWVKASALAPQAGVQAQARFLEGPIQGRAPMMITAPQLCIPPTEIDCVTRFCPTLPFGCATHAFPLCHPSVPCPSVPIQCPASDFVPCRTINMACPTQVNLCLASHQIICNPTNQIICHQTNPIVCQITRPIECIRQSVNVPCISAEFCPTLGPCPSIACGNTLACGNSVACGFGPGGGGFGPGGLIR